MKRYFVAVSLPAFALAATLAWLAIQMPSAHAAGVVGNGTPQSCTEGALIAAVSGGGLVTFDCGPSPTAINITLGRIDINQDTTVQGGGLVELNAHNTSGIFRINAGRNLTLTGIVLSNGQASPGSGGHGGCITVDSGSLMLVNASLVYCHAAPGYAGGGIYSINGMVTVVSTTVMGNSATYGGGIYVTGTAQLNISHSSININGAYVGAGLHIGDGIVTIEGSSVDSNVANAGYDGFGGGILVESGTLTIHGSIISGNTAPYGGGGGMYIRAGTTTLSETTVSGNSAPYGGGIKMYAGSLTIENATFYANHASANGGGMLSGGAITLTNVTLSANSASNGGGIYNVGNLTLLNVTLSTNSANYAGGGIYNGWQAIVKNSIIAYSPSGGDCAGVFQSNNSIASDLTCGLSGTGDRNGLDPKLSVLAMYFSRIRVHMLKHDSPAIDSAGSDAPPTDERGFPRPQPAGGLADIGAVERLSGDSDYPLRIYLPLTAH